MREFAAASGTLAGTDCQKINVVVEGTWQAHECLRLSTKDKGVARCYLAKIGGAAGRRSRGHVTLPLS